MSDADIHVPPYFLNRVVAALEQPGVGLVTTLYTALPGTPHLATLHGRQPDQLHISCPARCWPANSAGRIAWASPWR